MTIEKDTLMQVADRVKNALEDYQAGVPTDANTLPPLLDALAEGLLALLKARSRTSGEDR